MAATRDPSPAEIAAACLEIQSEWSERERMSRLRVDLRPTYRRCDGISEDIDEETYSRHHEQRELINAIGT